MATIHVVLAKVVNEGVAKLFYAHPSIQKTSLILNNKSVIKAPTGSIVQLQIKMMPSGKRILLRCEAMSYTSIQQFINSVGIDSMRKASIRSASEGYPVTTAFDGSDDKAYLIKAVIARFGDDTEQVNNDEPQVEEEPSDGFTQYGELFIPEIILRALRAAKDIASKAKAANVLLVGPSGNGKTSLAHEFASENGFQFVKVNCSVVRDPEEWFGYREAIDGSTVFVETDFTKAVKAGNAVILLDEINRLEPYLHNSLMPLLDETRRTSIHGNNIEVGDNVIFFCTMNLGIGFVGTFLLDTAVKNRMDATIVMEKLSFDREVQLLIERVGVTKTVASRIVTLMDKLRDVVIRNEMEVDISIRSSLKVARMVNTEIVDIREALTFVIFNNAEDVEQAKMLADALIGA
jgi:MoxR-like ATPase